MAVSVAFATKCQSNQHAVFSRTELPLKRPRLHSDKGADGIRAHTALVQDGDRSRPIADILVHNVSTRKYAHVVFRCADKPEISKSTVSKSCSSSPPWPLWEWTRRSTNGPYTERLAAAKTPRWSSACSATWHCAG